jgi:hypothetical protein
MPITRWVADCLSNSKGLWIGDYAGVIQIGGYLNSDGDVDNIPSAVFDQHIFKGVYGLPVVPHVVSISQLNESYQNKLIELNGVEFQTSDAGKNYADGYNKVSVNRTLKDCNGGTVLVRTSGYASFANSPTATGNGKLLAIYSSYNGDAQLLIRSLDDVMLDSYALWRRCNCWRRWHSRPSRILRWKRCYNTFAEGD